MNYQNLLNDIDNGKSIISKIENEIQAIGLKINQTISLIDDKFLSIAIEDVLLSLPSKAIGSQTYAKRLNSQSDLYQDSQFNKIIRFLDLIESIENDYNDSYSSVGRRYLKNPDKSATVTLVSKYSLIKTEYQLMNVLVEAVRTNKVLFNKIYNKLEDRGVFLTTYDKMNIQNLSTIADNMISLVEQSFLMNENLSSINNELWEANTKLEDMSDSMGKLDKSVKAGNLLNAVQTYQLYKINKNTNK